MGANYLGQEEAIAELSALSTGAKEFLNHHISNSCSVIVNVADMKDLPAAKEAAWHIIDDLRLAGIRRSGR